MYRVLMNATSIIAMIAATNTWHVKDTTIKILAMANMKKSNAKENCKVVQSNVGQGPTLYARQVSRVHDDR